MKLADEIKFNLMREVRSHAYDIIIPNFYVGWYEMDIFKLMQSGLIIEYEIKVSRSDFFADFKKGSGDKHLKMEKKVSECNRFYYVVPTDLIKVEEIPKYAGLLYFREGQYGIGHCDIVKNAPLIHKNKKADSIYKTLAHKLSFRSQIIEDKYRKLKYETEK
jgi:hypothetical protein